MGTILQAAGLTTGGAPEEWNVNRPEVVKGIYRSYVDAGSQVITTNTFGGTRFRLAGRISRLTSMSSTWPAPNWPREVADAADHEVLVAGDIGPSGEIMAPLGILSRRMLLGVCGAGRRVGRRRGGLLLDRDDERAGRGRGGDRRNRSASSLPIAATMTFDTRFRTMMASSRCRPWRRSTAGASA